MIFLAAWCLAAGSLLASASSASQHERRQGYTTFTVGQAVNTTSGTIVGHAARSRTQVSEYLGIPFAQPPVGDLRFAAPQPFNGTAPITASAFVGTTVTSEVSC